MSRQPASPVVRPLETLTSLAAARDLTLTKPVNEYGYHEGNFIVKNLLIEAGDERIVPLVSLWIKNDYINVYTQVCDVDGVNVRPVNATDITTNVLCDEIPCAVGTSNRDDIASDLATYTESLSSDGYEVDEIADNVRLYIPGSRVDAIIDF